MKCSTSLVNLIAAYQLAQQAWQAMRSETDESQSTEWDAYERAEAAVLHSPCRSIDDVRIKATFVLADANAFDTVRNCVDRVNDCDVPSLRSFLRSLLGEKP